MVNILFGTNVPELMRLIEKELQLEIAYREKRAERKFYEPTEMQPIEISRYNLIKAKEETAILAEAEAAERKRQQYLMFVTDEIMKNMPDMGVTIFGPHIQRDMYKKLMEPADAQKLSCKDRRVLQITKDDLEILHFKCDNPLPNIIWDYLLGKDLLTCLWKASDTDQRPIDYIISKYVYECNKPQPIIDDFGNIDPDNTNPPILPAFEIKLTPSGNEVTVKEKEASEIAIIDDEPIIDIDNVPGMDNEDNDGDEEGGEEEHEREDEDEGEETALIEEKRPTIISHSDIIPEIIVKKEPEIIKIPAVWAPSNHRGIAAAIYLFYRWHTGTFLPPDPVPEPPHLVVAFEAYKRKDVFEVIEKCRKDILAYGFFTDDDPETAKLITDSLPYYETKTPLVNDRLILKVAKKTSHTVLELAPFGPSYISANTVVGEKECKKLFPEGYATENDALLLKEKKKKKSKDKGKVDTIATTESVAEEIIDEEDIESTEKEEGKEEKSIQDNLLVEEGEEMLDISKEIEDEGEEQPELIEPVEPIDDSTLPPPAPESTEQTAPAEESTEQTAPVPESTEQTAPAPESTEQTAPIPESTEQTAPAPESTEQTAPAPESTEQSAPNESQNVTEESSSPPESKNVPQESENVPQESLPSPTQNATEEESPVVTQETQSFAGKETEAKDETATDASASEKPE